MSFSDGLQTRPLRPVERGRRTNAAQLWTAYIRGIVLTRFKCNPLTHCTSCPRCFSKYSCLEVQKGVLAVKMFQAAAVSTFEVVVLNASRAELHGSQGDKQSEAATNSEGESFRFGPSVFGSCPVTPRSWGTEVPWWCWWIC